MEKDITFPRSGAVLRLYLNPLGEKGDGRIQVFEMSEEKIGSHFGLVLPEQQKLRSVGWSPEISCQFGQRNIIEITVSPDSPILSDANFRKINCGLIGRCPPSASCEEVFQLPLEHHEESEIQEKNKKYKYEVTFINHEIRINGILLSKPRFDSENEVVFDYIFKNAGRKISREEIERGIGRPLKKRLPDILRDIGFTKNLKMFFPAISKTAVKFVPVLTQSQFKKSGSHELRISK